MRPRTRLLGLLAAAAVLASLLVAGPASARTAPTGVKWNAASIHDAIAAKMEAQGWTTADPTFADLPSSAQALPANVRAGMTNTFGMQVFCNQEGFWNGNKKWYRESTGRWYWMWGAVSVCVNANVWRPELSIWSKRSYGNLTVDGYFTLYWDHFRALSFASGTSEPSTIEGERNPLDVSCTSQVQKLEGQDRTRTVTRPWVASFIGYVAMDFRQPDCSFVHQTLVYSLGSYRVGPAPDYNTNFDEARTGWI
jgi:hypothetical protein